MSYDFEDEELRSSKGCSKYDYFDWYDYAKVEKLNQMRSKQWLKLYAKLRKAEKEGDTKAFTKIRESLRNHETENEILKRRAESAGYYWC